MVLKMVTSIIWLLLNISLITIFGQQHSLYNKIYDRIHEPSGVNNEAFHKIGNYLASVLSFQEQQSKKCDALDFKLGRLIVTFNDQNEILREEVRELARKINSIEWYSVKYESLLNKIRTDLESKNNNNKVNVIKEPSSAVTNIPLEEKLHSLAIIHASTRADIQEIRNSFYKFETNITNLQKSTNEIKSHQLTSPTKQDIKRILDDKSSQSNLISLRPTILSSLTTTTNNSSHFEKIPFGCEEIKVNISGIYQIRSNIFDINPQPFYAYCEADKTDDLKMWTIILNRAGSDIDFFRNWIEYKNGFGNIYADFWIGLQKLYDITTSKLHELKIILEDFNGEIKTAKYSAFAIDSEQNDYTLNVLGKYNGTAGDSLTYHAGNKFTTYDVDNDLWPEGNCAQSHFGGWWYKSCDNANLNGKYLGENSTQETRYQGMYWNGFHGPNYSLKNVKMMIRPV